MPPRDFAHGHTPLPTAEVLRHARSFCSSRGHHLSWLARLRIAKIAPFVCYVSSLNGKHRGNSSPQTKIQRHEFDCIVVHGANWLRSNDCQRRATSEKSVCRKTRSVF